MNLQTTQVNSTFGAFKLSEKNAVSNVLIPPPIDLSYCNRDYIWTDGTHIYKSYHAAGGFNINYVLKDGAWEEKTFHWEGEEPYEFDGSEVWTDGTNIYYSNSHILNGDTWEEKTWNGFTSINPWYMWTDGTNIYFSDFNYGGRQYILNGDTWEAKTWNGFTSIYGSDVWTDGMNIYYSTTHILNGDTWEEKSFHGLDVFYGSKVWTDGKNTYYSYNYRHYILKGDTWEEITLQGVTEFEGDDIWTDGTHIYAYSISSYESVMFLPSAAKIYSKFEAGWKQLGAIGL